MSVQQLISAASLAGAATVIDQTQYISGIDIAGRIGKVLVDLFSLNFDLAMKISAGAAVGSFAALAAIAMPAVGLAAFMPSLPVIAGIPAPVALGLTVAALDFTLGSLLYSILGPIVGGVGQGVIVDMSTITLAVMALNIL